MFFDEGDADNSTISGVFFNDWSVIDLGDGDLSYLDEVRVTEFLMG